ncbi:cation:proton antiporter [soil metagenome]
MRFKADSTTLPLFSDFGTVLAVADVPPMLGLLALLLASMVLVSLALVRFKQSLLIGYFACGIIAANCGQMLVSGHEMQTRMDSLAEAGVVLLMFTLGIEFSLAELRHLRRAAFVGGGIQCALTLAVCWGVFYLFGLPSTQALIAAVVVTISSTAVSMKTFQDMGTAASPSGRAALGIALFQDLLVIFFLMLLPALATVNGNTEPEGTLETLTKTFGKGVIFFTLVWFLGRYVMPKIMHAVARSRSRELFTLMVVALCVGITYLAAALGLSPALGAFVAGLVASGSIYSHRVMMDILPFKDLFLALFFVSVGLTMNVQVLWQNIGTVTFLTLAIILGKACIIGLSCRILRLNWRAAFLTMASLASLGEFSLVLMARAKDLMDWDPVVVQILTLSGALSMALVPAMMRSMPALSDFLEKRGILNPKRQIKDEANYRQKMKSLQGHTIICGYGYVGRRLHASLIKYGIECLVIELNVDTVKELKSQGISVLFADADHRETWMLARIKEASLVAFTFPDSVVAYNAIGIIKELSPEVPVLTRSRFASDRSRLLDRGATFVVQDESESAARMLEQAEGVFRDKMNIPAHSEDSDALLSA